MNYKHKKTKKCAIPSIDVVGTYDVEGESNLVPAWMIEDSDDWEKEYKVGSRIYDPVKHHVYTKQADGLWGNGSNIYLGELFTSITYMW